MFHLLLIIIEIKSFIKDNIEIIKVSLFCSLIKQRLFQLDNLSKYKSTNRRQVKSIFLKVCKLQSLYRFPEIKGRLSLEEEK